MTAAPYYTPTRTVTSKEALRHWKDLTDNALRAPVVITAHGRPRHVLLAYDDYERMRSQERQVYRTDELPPDLAAALLADLPNLRAPGKSTDDDDVIID